MSAVGSSSTVQRLVALRALGRERLGRPVVGDGGREQRDVERRRARAPRRASPRRSASGSISTPGGACDGEVRGEQDDLRPAPPRLLGERDAHPARRAVAEEAHRVERLARAAGGDEHAPARERRPGASSCSTRAAISSGSAMRPTPHSPSAVSPSSGPTSSTPRASSVSAFARVAGCAHMRGFIAGATSTGPRCASAASVEQVVGEAVRELRERVRRARRDDEQVGARQMRVEVVARRAAARARGTSRRGRTARRRA